MPQGKGTYKDQIGRPRKKNYERGGNVEPNFPMENDAISDANKMGQELREISLENVPMSNAQDRTQRMEMGGEVGTGVYEGGGPVKKLITKFKEKKAEKKREKARKKSVEDFPITGIVQPEKKGLKPAKVPSNPPLFKGDTIKEKILNQSILYNMGKKAGIEEAQGKKGKGRKKGKPIDPSRGKKK